MDIEYLRKPHAFFSMTTMSLNYLNYFWNLLMLALEILPVMLCLTIGILSGFWFSTKQQLTRTRRRLITRIFAWVKSLHICAFVPRSLLLAYFVLNMAAYACVYVYLCTYMCVFIIIEDLSHLFIFYNRFVPFMWGCLLWVLLLHSAHTHIYK